MYLNLNQLRSFYTAAKSKSITRAAAALSVTPGAVTLQIKQLEEHSGIRLLIRAGNTMRLTDAGSEIFEKAQKIFEEIENLEIFIENTGQRKAGILRIGSTETGAISVLPHLIKEFKKIYPGIKAVVDRGPTDYIVQSLMDRKNELVLTRYRPKDKGMKMRYMGKKEIILVAAKESTLLPQNTISPAELSEVPLIVPIKGSSTREIVRELIKQFDILPTVILESSSIAFMKSFTRDDDGVSFFIKDVVLDELSKGIFKEVPIKGCSLFIEWGIGYLNRADLSQASLAFLKMIEKAEDFQHLWH